jgi:hypothetical protein
MNQSDQSASLKVIVRVENTEYGKPSDFFINIRNINDASNPPNLQSFAGSQEGTIISLQRGIYSIDASASGLGAWYETRFSGDCTPTGDWQAQVNIESSEEKTCIITKRYSE